MDVSASDVDCICASAWFGDCVWAAAVSTGFASGAGGRLLPATLLAEMKTPGVAGGRYGLGLSWRGTPCGVTVFGNDGDALAYQAYSFSTADLRRQVTVAATPNFTADPDATADAFVDAAMCGP